MDFKDALDSCPPGVMPIEAGIKAGAGWQWEKGWVWGILGGVGG